MTDAATRTVIDTYPLTVDYSRSLTEVIAAGNYGSTSPYITEENFPTGKGSKLQVAEAILFYPDRIIAGNDVLAELERMGLRPGTMFELAHFGEQHPWLEHLLATLQGAGPRNPDEMAELYGPTDE